MFNRTLQVKMVKSKKDEAEQASQKEMTFEGKTAIIGYYFERCVKKAGQAALAYVVLDTARQVLVAQAKKK